MFFQRAISSGLIVCCRATSAWLLRPARTSRATCALNSAVKDRRRRLDIGERSWEASINHRTGPIPGAHFTVVPLGLTEWAGSYPNSSPTRLGDALGATIP